MAVQLRHGQAVEAAAAVPAAVPLRARSRLHEVGVGAVHQVGAVAVVDAAIVLDLGHALGDQVELVENDLIGEVVVAVRAVEAAQRPVRVAGIAGVEVAADVEVLTVQPRTVEELVRAFLGRLLVLFLLFVLLLFSLGFSAAGFSSALAAGGAGGWLLGEAGWPPLRRRRGRIGHGIAGGIVRLESHLLNRAWLLHRRRHGHLRHGRAGEQCADERRCDCPP